MRRYIIILLVLLVFLLSSCTYKVIKNSSEKISPECLKAGERDVRGGVPSDEDIKSLKPCCAGLKVISAFDEEVNGKCLASAGGYGYMCSPCGNGKCESEYGENKCNCAEDCK